MPHPSPDPALRRMVADLAQLHVHDIAAILDDLDAADRHVVEGLLREHANYFEDVPPPASAPPDEPIDTARLSPWLARRLLPADGDGFAVTSEARQALRDAVIRLNATPAQPVAATKFGFFRRKAAAPSPGRQTP